MSWLENKRELLKSIGPAQYDLLTGWLKREADRGEGGESAALEHETSIVLQSDESALIDLPQTSIAAYLARCARRVQPMFQPQGESRDELLALIDRAIGHVEAFARGTLTGEQYLADANSMAEAALSGSTSTPGWNAFRAATMALCAVGCFGTGSPMDGMTFALTFPLFALIPAGETVDPAHRDLRALKERGGGPYRETGEPIDPGEQGPLGALWPRGAPEWFAGEGPA